MVLDEIVANKRHEIDAAQAKTSLRDLEERIESVGPARSLRDALRKDGISFITEIKRASPSRGDMLPDLDAIDVAALYEQCGTRAISVLTDTKYFKGTLADLTSVRTHVRVPCLRKEFIVDPFQIYEARAAQADAVLLIVRILEDAQLKRYIEITRELGMQALVETHTEDEIKRAIDAGAHIIGINNRDLDTLEVDVMNTMRLRKCVPGGITLVSESGIRTRDDVRKLEDGGIDALLVGESLLTSGNIRGKLLELMGAHED